MFKVCHEAEKKSRLTWGEVGSLGEKRRIHFLLPPTVAPWSLSLPDGMK